MRRCGHPWEPVPELIPSTGEAWLRRVTQGSQPKSAPSQLGHAAIARRKSLRRGSSTMRCQLQAHRALKRPRAPVFSPPAARRPRSTSGRHRAQCAQFYSSTPHSRRLRLSCAATHARIQNLRLPVQGNYKHIIGIELPRLPTLALTIWHSGASVRGTKKPVRMAYSQSHRAPRHGVVTISPRALRYVG